ncbi:MALT paracaspase 2 [Oreochromis niloticus]|uniref:MALT paracaspase 2 n=1 Tax=Oreochromis niloticus TaxID=8128 RepID=I3J201_ORENI|nr:mucosa-associated lymphoid tissue lymphoma translocation protein 1 homolog [Oreochromis niloticus]XP_005479086.1 mucosa-associated lymphoid tissue lymphoma translocation protein 1 homolog [Oreochromis niloticus]XP_005479087.1 mucosa-associated lymphoid tissue lymphoma translocation protein 1 homolog [Oreochromis niloticus]XP_005479088.1 mucosa-associated lymphoid tissue lymphoma translocation protein 1 homolog [Oreochromis niloticus]XP_005479089.1 mucosa-associated lymphoid tissue lymphoma t
MEEWKRSIGTLSDEILIKLAKMLDNSTCGWRQLANAVSEQPKFCCSERELTSCSLQVLSPAGSPARTLLALLAERSCSLDFLLHCLRKMEHQEAVQFLTTAVAEQIQITVQPQSQEAAPGSSVVLTCRTSGPPGLGYQWFKGKQEILGETGNSSELVLCPLSPAHQGHYICRISHGEKFVFSKWAKVRLICSAGCSSSLFPGSVSGLHIIQHPQSQAASEGDILVLECTAEGNPPAQYEWYHNKVPMPQQKTSSVRIPCVTTAHRGEYTCKVFNLYHEVWSSTATVTIGPSSVTDASWVEVDRGRESQEVHKTYGAGIHPLQQIASPPPSAKDFYATDKVALLIGNMNYIHHTQLCAPISDVHELTNLLRQLDFKVVSLLDLNWQEMHSAVTEFLLLLDKGVYGLLYFAGHGYENYGNSFMVPIDAPVSYTSEHCLCVQNILTKMQEKKTGLNVFLLDMCRKRNPHDDVIVQPGLLKVTANIVFGYATCVDAEAYEVKREDVSNGIFISFLKRRVCEDEKVTVMLDRVAEDMGRCVITRGRQALELRSNLSERRSLTDRIQVSECSASSSARNLQWAIAHVLPESRYLQFDCGVKVQLGFAAEFSNVMVIYTRILDKPDEIVSCSAQLTDFPEDVDIDLKKSNQESLLEAGCLLLIKEELPSPEAHSLYTRIRSLQRLKRELTFTICLHYTYSNMDEEVQERQQVTVGRPLVSKLNLHEPRAARVSAASSSFSLDSFNFPGCSSFGEDLSPTGRASNTWSHHAQSASVSFTGGSLTSPRSANVPEETDSPEILDNPRPLVASKSLPHSKVNDSNYKFSDMYNFHSY